MYNLYYNTVSPLLRKVLDDLMQEKLFDSFRLIGGTSLSLQMGHRLSDDIDMFTDELYSTINFGAIDTYLKSKYEKVRFNEGILPGMGKSYTIIINEETVKVDVFYADGKFIREPKTIDGIRLATKEEIIAMKLDVLQRKGRKKDFWDLHELSFEFSLEQMLTLHEERYPYSHDRELIKRNFTNFDDADYFVDPVCLRGKYWELIKADLVEFVEK